MGLGVQIFASRLVDHLTAQMQMSPLASSQRPGYWASPTQTLALWLPPSACEAGKLHGSA